MLSLAPLLHQVQRFIIIDPIQHYDDHDHDYDFSSGCDTTNTITTSFSHPGERIMDMDTMNKSPREQAHVQQPFRQRQHHPSYSSPSCHPPALLTATSLPEIISLIACNLSKVDVASCTLVCRAWSLTFTPFLWRVIRARIPNPHNAMILPRLLAKYGGLIKTLSITDLPEHFLLRADPSTELVFDCPAVENITHLTVNMERDKKLAVKSIVHRNKKTLRVLWLTYRVDKSLKVGSVTGVTTTATATGIVTGPGPGTEVKHSKWNDEPLFEFPTLDGGMQCLRSLYLENWCLTRQELVKILMACPALKSLSFAGIRIRDMDDDNDSSLSSSPSSLKSLSSTSLDNHPFQETKASLSFQHHGIETFRMCAKLYPILDLLPNLRTLEFFRFDRAVPTETVTQFCRSIQQHCPRLTQLWPLGFECSMLPPILDSLHTLTVFRGSSDMETVLSILDHASTLEEANLSDYTEKTFLPLRFLESCPQLKRFRTGHSSTTMQEVKESILGSGKGWVCKGLKVLRLSIFRMSPALIEKVMRDLGAVREADLMGLSARKAGRMSAARKTVMAAEAVIDSERAQSGSGSGSGSGRSNVECPVADVQDPSHLSNMSYETGTPAASASASASLSSSSTATGADPMLTDISVAEKRAQAYLAMKKKHELMLQEGIENLTADQLEFQRMFSGYLRGFTQLTWVNFGTGWYCIPKEGVVEPMPMPEP
ncbi:hypothetical protein EDD11_004149 [Mortierella claussenii]|nr:hypothetical protein EDD11_004149 [Mortierella claussenii]